MTSHLVARVAVAETSSTSANTVSTANPTATSLGWGVWMTNSIPNSWAALAIIHASCPPPMTPIRFISILST